MAFSHTLRKNIDKTTQVNLQIIVTNDLPNGEYFEPPNDKSLGTLYLSPHTKYDFVFDKVNEKLNSKETILDSVTEKNLTLEKMEYKGGVVHSIDNVEEGNHVCTVHVVMGLQKTVPTRAGYARIESDGEIHTNRRKQTGCCIVL